MNKKVWDAAFADETPLEDGRTQGEAVKTRILAIYQDFFAITKKMGDMLEKKTDKANAMGFKTYFSTIVFMQMATIIDFDDPDLKKPLPGTKSVAETIDELLEEMNNH